MDDRPYVAVVGPSQGAPDELAAAEQVGRLLAQRGAVIVCGGGGGAMAAAARGARSAGGVVVGLLPGDDRSAASPGLTVAIATGLGELRNGLVVRAADGVVAIAGAFGTLSEIAFALRVAKPVVGLGTWELARGGAPAEGIVAASSAEDAVERVLSLIAR
jgi:uncharacterized protein (TIGR00725 family)